MSRARILGGETVPGYLRKPMDIRKSFKMGEGMLSSLEEKLMD